MSRSRPAQVSASGAGNRSRGAVKAAPEALEGLGRAVEIDSPRSRASLFRQEITEDYQMQILSFKMKGRG